MTEQREQLLALADALVTLELLTEPFHLHETGYENYVLLLCFGLRSDPGYGACDCPAWIAAACMDGTLEVALNSIGALDPTANGIPVPIA